MVLKPTYEELEQRGKELEKVANDRVSSEKHQKLLLLAVNQSSEGIAVVDMNGNLEYLNNAFAEMHGYSVAELVGKNLSTFHTPEQMPYVEAANLELKQKDSFKGEIWHVRRDGTVFPTLMHNSLIRDKTNKPIGMMGTLRDITERKQAEEALRKSEERHRTLFETMAQGVVYQNAEGKILSANPSAEKILGLSIDQMKGRTSVDPQWKSIHEDGSDFRGETHPSIVALNTGQKVKDVIMGVFNPQTESYRWININAIPQFKDGEESPYQVYTTFDDITERKLAERKLRESEEKLRTVLDSTPFPVAVVDLQDDKIFFWSRSALTLFGHTAPTASEWYQIAYPDPNYRREVIDRWKPFLEIARESRQAVNTGEYQVTCRDGSVRICELYATFLPDILIVTFNDITERKRAEDALRESSERLDKAQHVARMGFLDWDLQTNQILWSDEVYHLLGIGSLGSPQTVESTIALVHPDDLKIVQQSLENAVAGISEHNLDHRMVRPDGEVIWVYAQAELVYDEAGNPKTLLGTMVDITKFKQAEEEKRKALEFTAERSKHALIGQVAGKMAHDFNNVLMGIMGNAQLAVLDCDDEKTKEKLEWIIDFSERGRDITNSLLSFSKDQEPKQTYFKIVDKIDLVLKMLEKELTGIKVSRNYTSGIPELLADPGMIQDVLVNLVQNSIHAMSKVKNPTLNLKAYSQDNKVYFEIKDNGCGIPKEHQDSIYTPSFTLKGSHDKTGSYKSDIKGTGYGMSNVKKYIVEKHKGDISLESEVGKGTRITIGLRIIKDHLSSDEKKEVVKSQIYDKKRILLVEDESAIADVQYQILTQEPFNHIVSIAANGQIAIDIFGRNKFDVVSLDYMLPGKINGLDVYNHIREKDKNIPVMFISGNIEFIESMSKLREKDPNLEHLSKPVDNLEYVNKINELVGRSVKKNVPSTVFSQYLK